MFLRHALRGNFRPLALRTRSAAYGLTHPRCKRCGKREWPRTRFLCCYCQMENIMQFLFDEGDE